MYLNLSTRRIYSILISYFYVNQVYKLILYLNYMIKTLEESEKEYIGPEYPFDLGLEKRRILDEIFSGLRVIQDRKPKNELYVYVESDSVMVSIIKNHPTFNPFNNRLLIRRMHIPDALRFISGIINSIQDPAEEYTLVNPHLDMLITFFGGQARQLSDALEKARCFHGPSQYYRKRISI